MDSSELRGTSGATTSKALWDLLVSRKESAGSAGLNSALASLFQAKAETEADIPEHLTKIKELQARINTYGLKYALNLPDWMFTAIMINTLPSSWEAFTNAYAGSLVAKKSDEEASPYRVSSQEMESILMDEWRRRNPSGTVVEETALFTKQNGNNRGIRTNEKMKCFNCNKMGHKKEDCWAPGGGSEGKGPRQKSSNGGRGGGHRANFTDVDKNPFKLVYSIESSEAFTPYTWLADSASSTHLALKREFFTEYEPLNNMTIRPISGTPIPAAGRGTVLLDFDLGTSRITHTLKDVLHVPNAKHNLVSTSRIDAAGLHMVYGGGMCQITRGRRIMGTGRCVQGMYVLDAKARGRMERIMTVSEEKSIGWDELHRRFGHVSTAALMEMKKKGMVNGLNVDETSKMTDCEACIKSKLAHRPFPAEASTRADKPGERTYSDLWGPCQTTSIGGARYFMTLTDDYSRRCCVIFLRDKSQAAERMKEYITWVKRRWDRQPKVIGVDNGREFVNQTLQSWCQSQGIELQKTAPYSPSQNGVAERFNRTLVELSRAMLIARNLPNYLWAEAVRYAAYVRGCVPSKALGDITPHEAWTGQKPDVVHLREFGARTFGPNHLRGVSDQTRSYDTKGSNQHISNVVEQFEQEADRHGSDRERSSEEKPNEVGDDRNR
ncbi:hypothetical protein PIIN_10253 [Serendipita indica DSM 11827]|uniref:Integrase catalytic domain-containing protein n=1 Tax=Serendipita indica (strain DSM 11827) TaxID=1109443 RepID=G4TY65_SERID|nr:hypothetical protein PIIN_10253 [Serendipita indica DSM 11827]